VVQVSGYKPITPSFQATSPCYSHDSIHGEIEAINGWWLHEGLVNVLFLNILKITQQKREYHLQQILVLVMETKSPKRIRKGHGNQPLFSVVSTLPI
jgi:hypothetical protein